MNKKNYFSICLMLVVGILFLAFMFASCSQDDGDSSSNSSEYVPSNGNTDGGSTNDWNTNDWNTNDWNTNDWNTNGGNTGGGTVQQTSLSDFNGMWRDPDQSEPTFYIKDGVVYIALSNTSYSPKNVYAYIYKDGSAWIWEYKNDGKTYSVTVDKGSKLSIIYGYGYSLDYIFVN